MAATIPPMAQASLSETTASPRPGRLRRFVHRHERWLMLAAGMLIAGAAMFLQQRGSSANRDLTQEDIDNAVQSSLENKPPPSVAAKAFEAIRPSVVRVEGVFSGATGEPDMDGGVGTGVVIVDKGIILTNMHVISGAERVKVIFADGLESEATVTGVKPEHDLAILQAKTIPDDLKPATLRSTGDLQIGDHVVAVGFPFGIGPSASSGVVSGLKREFVSPEGKKSLTNLIQFDAAANPGNSGGPLVTADGQVVGIVTAILNPTSQRVFIGIGFAVPIENAASSIGVSPF
jgi:S1-C subfamily serine protease